MFSQLLCFERFDSGITVFLVMLLRLSRVFVVRSVSCEFLVFLGGPPCWTWSGFIWCGAFKVYCFCLLSRLVILAVLPVARKALSIRRNGSICLVRVGVLLRFFEGCPSFAFTFRTCQDKWHLGSA